jgi:hypothetical protein
MDTLEVWNELGADFSVKSKISEEGCVFAAVKYGHEEVLAKLYEYKVDLH